MPAPAGSAGAAYGGAGSRGGFSDGGASADPGNLDITTALPSFPAATFTVLPLAVSASSRPVIGTNWNLTTSNVPATGLVGIDVGGLSDPGLNDLAFLGLPGCGLRASLDAVIAWPVTGSTHTFTLPVPNDPTLVNLRLYLTSAVLQPGVNPFGAITANGIEGKIGNL